MAERPTDDDSNDPASAIAFGYEAVGEVLELGSVVVDGAADPAAHVRIPLATVNRHGLVTGATGSGRARTLQVIAEQLSAAGIPVVMGDATSGLSGLSSAGEPDEAAITRAGDTGDEMWTPSGNPVLFYSFGTAGVGVPVRATVTSFGPVLLGRALRLGVDEQTTLDLFFDEADRRGAALLDLADLRRVIEQVEVGGARGSSVEVLGRRIAELERSDAGTMFGEPELDTADLVRLVGGSGVINLIEHGPGPAPSPLYSTLLLWLLAGLHQSLPDVGDLDRPALVFVVDEAHLLFDDAPPGFVAHIEGSLQALRTKGIGVFFCTHRSADIPRDILAQLGTRVQHAPEDGDEQDTRDDVVRSYPATDVYDIERVLGQLGIGEALVTVPSEIEERTPVAWTRVRAPQSLMGTVGESAMRAFAQASSLYGKYGRDIDRDSAYDKLAASTFGEPPDEGEVERGLFGVAVRRNRSISRPD